MTARIDFRLDRRAAMAGLVVTAGCAATGARGSASPQQDLMGTALVVLDLKAGNDRPVIARATGWARNKTLSMTVDAPVRVASISKFVCAIAAHLLVEEGKLDLDADVSPRLGFSFRNPGYPDRAIRLRQLLSHTSSLRDAEVYWANFPKPLSSLFTGADSLGRWAAEPPGFFTYCNLNYGVIAQTMEQASGERFDRLMQARVFAPLRIEAGYNWSGVSAARRAAAASLYRRTGPDGETPDPKGPWTVQVDGTPETASVPTYRAEPAAPSLDTYAVGTNGTLFSPQGGLRISVRDLALIGLDLLRAERGEGYAVTPHTAAGLQAPVWLDNGSNGATDNGFYRSYGAGAQLLKEGVYGHFGDAYGLRSGLLIDPRRTRVCAYAITGFAIAPALGWDRAEIYLLERAGFAHALA